eukprot:14372-Heterococcus_DN1.PRE.1
MELHNVHGTPLVFAPADTSNTAPALHVLFYSDGYPDTALHPDGLRGNHFELLVHHSQVPAQPPLPASQQEQSDGPLNTSSATGGITVHCQHCRQQLLLATKQP